MKHVRSLASWKRTAIFAAVLASTSAAQADAPEKRPSSYAPVVIKEDFAAIMARMKAEKPGVMKRQMDLLVARYDLANRPASGSAKV